MTSNEIPIRPPDRPTLCSPYVEPTDHWLYDRDTGEARHGGQRRPAGYFYKTERTGSAQRTIFGDEFREDLPLVNRLRADVRHWRQSTPAYRGASEITKRLLRHWTRPDRPRRLFFCQQEAVETIVYLAEMRLSGRSTATGFKKFEVTDHDLERLLRGEQPGFELTNPKAHFPTLIDLPA
ncbi:MAG TPA: hypothetical protein VKD90_15985, partial [Gemmataceae bacterium]|nr:hypothetical protein [Gemmataceae bacterium]